MTNLQRVWATLLIIVSSHGGAIRAQTDPFFAKKPAFATLSERWEPDSANRRGTFLVRVLFSGHFSSRNETMAWPVSRDKPALVN